MNVNDEQQPPNSGPDKDSDDSMDDEEPELPSQIKFFGDPPSSPRQSSSSSSSASATSSSSSVRSDDTTAAKSNSDASSSSSPSIPSIPDVIPSSLTSSFDDDSAKFEELPLFPLQLVMSPGSFVPLHIFESRYRLLFSRLRDRAAAGGQSEGRFGIVLSGERLALIGCIAEVVRFDGLPDGRILTNNVGRHRFRIVRIVEEKPYIIAKVAPVHDDTPSENLMPLAVDVWKTLTDVLDISNRLYDKKHELSVALKKNNPGNDGQALLPRDEEERGKQTDGGSENVAAVPKGWPCPRRVEEFSFAVCDILDNSITGQQLMLQTTSTSERLGKQLKTLSMARQYLAAQMVIKDAGLK